LDREDNEPGVACVGGPILDLTGSAIAAMSLSGPVGRVLKQEKEIGTALSGCCRESQDIWALWEADEPNSRRLTSIAPSRRFSLNYCSVDGRESSLEPGFTAHAKELVQVAKQPRRDMYAVSITAA